MRTVRPGTRLRAAVGLLQRVVCLPRLPDLEGQDATTRIGIDGVVGDLVETGGRERRAGIEGVDNIERQRCAGGTNMPAGSQVDGGECRNAARWDEIGVGIGVGVVDGGIGVENAVRPARRCSKAQLERLAVGVDEVGADAAAAKCGFDVLDVRSVEIENEFVGGIQVHNGVCDEIKALSALLGRVDIAIGEAVAHTRETRVVGRQIDQCLRRFEAGDEGFDRGITGELPYQRPIDLWIYEDVAAIGEMMMRLL